MSKYLIRSSGKRQAPNKPPCPAAAILLRLGSPVRRAPSSFDQRGMSTYKAETAHLRHG
jgi:hypothetical protein